MALCPELAALFKAPAEAAAETHAGGAGKGRPYQPGSPEVNNSMGERRASSYRVHVSGNFNVVQVTVPRVCSTVLEKF